MVQLDRNPNAIDILASDAGFFSLMLTAGSSPTQGRPAQEPPAWLGTA
jgi:hypothetical protein